jgi:hypothetical protein
MSLEASVDVQKCCKGFIYQHIFENKETNVFIHSYAQVSEQYLITSSSRVSLLVSVVTTYSLRLVFRCGTLISYILHNNPPPTPNPYKSASFFIPVVPYKCTYT